MPSMPLSADTNGNSSTLSAMSSPVGATVVIFGASGDLTSRKLLPALFELWRGKHLSDKSPIVGVARRAKSDDEFRKEMHAAVSQHGRSGKIADDEWGRFARRLFYRELDL